MSYTYISVGSMGRVWRSELGSRGVGWGDGGSGSSEVGSGCVVASEERVRFGGRGRRRERRPVVRPMF